MKRNKQSKYRIKIIQEFHLNKNKQKWINSITKDYKRIYNIFKGVLPRINAFKSIEFKFKDMPYFYIDDIDRNSTIPNTMKHFELGFKSIENYNKILGGNNNA